MRRVPYFTTLTALTALLAACATTPTDALRLSAPERYDDGRQIIVSARSKKGGIRIVITDRRGTIHFDSAKERWTDDTRVSVHWVPPYNGVPPYRVEATDGAGARVVKRVRKR